MEFQLLTSGYFYPEESDRKKLEKLGFTFIPSDYKEFKINFCPKIKINTIEELIKLSDKYGDLIIRDGEIEIYDDYRE